jgi:hypothetical protein
MANRQPCPKCDELVPAGARECPECGARLTSRARRDDDDDRPPARDRRDSDRPRKKKRSKAKPVNRILIPAIAGGAILLAGVTVLVIWAAGWFGGGHGTGGEPRPERSKTAVNEFEPVAWAVPDGAAAVQPWPAAITLPGVKAVAFPPGPRRTFLAVQAEIDKSDAFHATREALVAGELDPNTGQPMPAVRRLDPRLIVPAKSRMVPMALPPATVNGAGVLATRGLEPGSVEFHAPDGGKRTARLGTTTIDWLLWADDSTLLVLTRGQLVGWDATADRARFTAGQEYQLPTCNFDYSGALSEAVLLGVVSYRLGKPLEWDAKTLKAKGVAEADALIKKEYRKGWEV